ncbi:MAG: class II aldolase/adducin family protein [Armatimonadetes bacterium]|nr:class II aldolase/adducin family protein [Armatimonadota bacterium]
MTRRDQCSLCGKDKERVPKLIVGLQGAVCSDCIDLCQDILQHEQETGQSPALADATLRGLVCEANRLLLSRGLVTAQSGNVSALDDVREFVYIKPSGINYELLNLTDIVRASLADGTVPTGSLKPSVDLPHHLYLYRNIPDIFAIVHTHSTYATAFAACLKPIPLVLTAMADVFGGEVPCTPYVDNEGEHIGEAILKHKTDAPAILLGNHGVFTWGKTVKDALKAAVVVEDVAKTVAVAMGIGKVVELSPGEAAKWFDRYQNRYGQ